MFQSIPLLSLYPVKCAINQIKIKFNTFFLFLYARCDVDLEIKNVLNEYTPACLLEYSVSYAYPYSISPFSYIPTTSCHRYKSSREYFTKCVNLFTWNSAIYAVCLYCRIITFIAQNLPKESSSLLYNLCTFCSHEKLFDLILCHIRLIVLQYVENLNYFLFVIN